MKKLSLLLITLCLAWSCQDNSSSNQMVVDQYVNAVQKLDYTTALDLLAEDYIGYGPSVGDSIQKQQVEASMRFNMENTYESIEYKKSRTISVHIPDGDNKGEWVSHWAQLLINYQDGQSAELMANSIYQLEGGKIIRSYTFYNEADALEQLGYVFVNLDDL